MQTPEVFLTLPNGQKIPYISETNYAETMRNVVEPYLAARRTELEVPVTNGTLHAENYILPDAKEAIVLIHGFSETAAKFREVVWSFVHAGFTVFSFDVRGHGRSLRHVEDTNVVHVLHFQDYVNDLEEFILQCVRPAVGKMPLYLYAHSCGGAIGAHFLVRHPDTFSRAILTSPMIAPSAAPYPLWVGRAMAGFFCIIGKKTERAFISGPFDPATQVLETSCSTSAARFDYYTQKRIADPLLQHCAPTYGWTWEAAAQTAGLMHKKETGKIQTKVLVCQAGLDNTVLNPMQDKFVSMIPGAKLARFEGAKHEIYNSTDDVMKPYMQTILQFFTTK